MKKIVIAFRGRNTDQILKDFGKEADIIVCREGDKLFQFGDVTAQEAVTLLHNAYHKHLEACQWAKGCADQICVTLIANGGTTEQQVPLLKYLFSNEEGWLGAYQVVQVERDGTLLILEERSRAFQKY